MSDTVDHRPRVLPATVADLLAMRRAKSAPALHDEVERIFLVLYQEPAFRRLQVAEDGFPEDAVEGSVSIDRMESARLIRNWARENEMPFVAEQKLVAIVRSVGVVRRRFDL
jgi:hypothetical protein